MSVTAPARVEAKPGGETVIALQVVVKPGYHVQANPVENPSLVPITLKIAPTASVWVGDPHYPAARRMRLRGDSQDLVVYDGTFAIALPIQVGPDATTGAQVVLKGTLRYQACDDRHCLLPVTLPVVLPITVGVQ